MREDQRRKKIKGNKEFYNVTSSNISKIAKRKITISRKHQIIIKDISIHIKNKKSQNVSSKEGQISQQINMT
jgi:hypothetical protein